MSWVQLSYGVWERADPDVSTLATPEQPSGSGDLSHGLCFSSHAWQVVTLPTHDEEEEEEEEEKSASACARAEDDPVGWGGAMSASRSTCVVSSSNGRDECGKTPPQFGGWEQLQKSDHDWCILGCALRP